MDLQLSTYLSLASWIITTFNECRHRMYATYTTHFITSSTACIRYLYAILLLYVQRTPLF